MGGAGDARIIIANGLLTLPGQVLIRKMQRLRHKVPEIAFDGFLVLRRLRHALCTENLSLIVDAIAMIKRAARRFGTGIASRSSRLHRKRWRLRHFIVLNDPQRLIKGVEDFY